MNEPNFGRREGDAMLEALVEMLVGMSDANALERPLELRAALPPEHPVQLVCGALNDILGALREARERARAYEGELSQKLATIDEQRRAIREQQRAIEEQRLAIEAQRRAIDELSTPVLEVAIGVLCLPIVSTVDERRAAAMTDKILAAVTEKDARCVILDTTGLVAVEATTADHFLRIVTAVRMLGAECIVSGMTPAVARTFVELGVDLASIETFRTLRAALASRSAVRLGGSRRVGP